MPQTHKLNTSTQRNGGGNCDGSGGGGGNGNHCVEILENRPRFWKMIPFDDDMNDRKQSRVRGARTCTMQNDTGGTFSELAILGAILSVFVSISGIFDPSNAP